MNFLDSNLLLVYLNLFFLLILVGLRIYNSTKRHQEWMLKSFLVGLGIGPALGLAIGILSQIEGFSYASGSLSLFEMGILSGLSWSVASTWLLSTKLIAPPVVAVTINWLKVAAFYGFIIVAALISRSLKVDTSLVLVVSVGLVSIALAARNPKLLAYSAISGIIFMLFSVALAYLATYFHAAASYQLPFTAIQLAIPFSLSVAVGFLALLAPIVSHWWFGQPLNASR